MIVRIPRDTHVRLSVSLDGEVVRVGLPISRAALSAAADSVPDVDNPMLESLYIRGAIERYMESAIRSAAQALAHSVACKLTGEPE